MTGSVDPTRDAAAADAPEVGPPIHPTTFSLEGRSVPGLYLAGWFATLSGSGTLFVGLLAGGGATAAWLVVVALLFLSFGLFAAAGSQAIDRRVRAEAGTGLAVGPSPFLVFAAGIPPVLLLSAGIGALAVALGLDATAPIVTVVALALQGLIYVGLVGLLVVGTGALSWSAMGFTRPGPGALRDLLAGALLAVPVLVVTELLAAVLVTLVGSSPTPILPSPTDAPTLVLDLVAAAVIAPIGEETFFRAFATTAWARALGPTGGLVRAALFFAAAHVLQVSGANFGDAAGTAIVAFVARLPVALILGWVFLRRGSIWAPLGLHAAFNGLIVVLALAAG